jgi:DedD protein
MGLFSFLKRNTGPAPAAGKPAKSGAKAAGVDEVQVLRVRARRRLIGAAVLVAAGVVVFPLIFETQPRPIPVDLPIEIPRKENAPPLVVPTREPLVEASPAPAPATATVTAPAPAPASATVAAVEPASKPVAVESAAVNKPVTAKPAADKPKPADKPAVTKPAAGNDGARAQALLEGKDTPAAAPGRFIVQVGAFAENKAAQEMRLKVEKLGLKTYAQAVDTADGHRVRVRLGPFANRDEAEHAAAKLRAAGLPGAILTL